MQRFKRFKIGLVVGVILALLTVGTVYAWNPHSLAKLFFWQGATTISEDQDLSVVDWDFSYVSGNFTEVDALNITVANNSDSTLPAKISCWANGSFGYAEVEVPAAGDSFLVEVVPPLDVFTWSHLNIRLRRSE